MVPGGELTRRDPGLRRGCMPWDGEGQSDRGTLPHASSDPADYNDALAKRHQVWSSGDLARTAEHLIRRGLGPKVYRL